MKNKLFVTSLIFTAFSSMASADCSGPKYLERLGTLKCEAGDLEDTRREVNNCVYMCQFVEEPELGRFSWIRVDK